MNRNRICHRRGAELTGTLVLNRTQRAIRRLCSQEIRLLHSVARAIPRRRRRYVSAPATVVEPWEGWSGKDVEEARLTWNLVHSLWASCVACVSYCQLILR